MAKDIVISFEIEPIVHLTCVNGKCEFNLAWAGYASCNLKHIRIGKDGCCTECVVKGADDAAAEAQAE